MACQWACGSGSWVSLQGEPKLLGASGQQRDVAIQRRAHFSTVEGLCGLEWTSALLALWPGDGSVENRELWVRFVLRMRWNGASHVSLVPGPAIVVLRGR